MWKIIASATLGIIGTSFVSWLAFGIDSVKHNEIDQIMLTRAPYMHDKQRIQDKNDEQDRELALLRSRVEALVVQNVVHGETKNLLNRLEVQLEALRQEVRELRKDIKKSPP